MVINLPRTVAKNESLGPGKITSFFNAVKDSSSRLEPWEHDNECPVYHGASSDCVWPILVCVEDSFTYPEVDLVRCE